MPVLPSEITHFVARTMGRYRSCDELGIADTIVPSDSRPPALMPHMFVRDMNFGKYDECSAGRNVELFYANGIEYSEEKYFSRIDIKTTTKCRSSNIVTATSPHSLNGYRFSLRLYTASTNAVMRLLSMITHDTVTITVVLINGDCVIL